MKIDRYKSQLNKAFGLIFILGTILIFAGGGSPVGWIGPVVAMQLYIAYGLSASKKIRSTSEFADSVYYLGFVFTMISLLSSTWVKIDVDSPDKILELFAIALITTIIGIVARLFLSQFDRTTDEQVEDANQRILDMVDDYIERLGLISSETDEKSTVILESYDKLVDSYISQSQKVSDNFKQILNDQSVEIISGIAHVSTFFQEQINNHVNNIVNDMNSIHLDTENISTQYSEQISELFNQLSISITEAKSNTQELAGISANVNAGLRESPGGVQNSITEGMIGVKASLTNVTTNLELSANNIASDIKDNMGIIHGNLATIAEGGEAKTQTHITQLETALGNSVDHLETNYTTIFGRLENTTSNAVTKIDDSIQSIDTGLTGAFERLREIVSGLDGVSFDKDIFQDILESISNLNATFLRTSSTLNDTYVDYNNRLILLKDTNTEFEDQISTLKTLLEQMNDTLAEQIQRR